MSESDTMFNKQDQRCATLWLMLSADPSYDSQNHRWIVTNNRDEPRVMKTKFLATVMVFGVLSSEGHIMLPHIFEVNTKVHLDVLKSVVIPRCNQVGVAAGLGAGPQVQRDPGLVSEGVLQLCTLLSLAPLLPTPEPTGLLRLVIRWEHHQHDLPQHQSQPDHCHPPSSCRRLWKRHAPSSGSISRRWLRLKAATLRWCQLYYIFKLPELIFSIKILKWSCSVVFFRTTILLFHPVLIMSHIFWNWMLLTIMKH